MGKFDQLKKSIGTRLTDDAGHRPQAVGTSHLHGAMMIDLARITPDPEQPRKEFDKSEIDLLGKSLKQAGQQQPIRVRYDADLDLYVIIAGERRFRAAKSAGIKSLQAIVDDRELTPDTVLAMQLVENAIRTDLKPLEAANAYEQLMTTMGLDQKGLAKFLNISTSKVSRTLSLSKLPPEEQAAIESGKAGPMSTVVKSRRKPKTKAKKPQAITIRTAAGSVVVTPKRGQSVVDVLSAALDHESKAKAA